MAWLNELRSFIGQGVIKFMYALFLANRDYPYNDFKTATTTATGQLYRVGSQNMLVGGTQHKMFTSKSTLIYCTTNTYVRLNSAQNVAHLLLANVWYEFKSNIHLLVYYYASAEGTIYIHCEGVLPNEARFTE